MVNIRKRLERIKGHFEEKVHDSSTSGHNPPKPTCSKLDVTAASQCSNILTPPQSPIEPPLSPTLGSQPLSPPLSEGGPARTVDDTWPCLKAFLRILAKSTSIFGPLKMVVDEFVECVEIYENAVAGESVYEVLRIQLEVLFDDLGNHFSGNLPVAMTASMENLCSALRKELKHISSKMEKTTWNQYVIAKENLEDVTECYYRIQGYLQRLTLNANLNMWQILDEQSTEARLNRLQPSLSACYNSAEASLVRRRECTPETRKQVLADLCHWRNDKTLGQIYWMNGMAGTGKTTIANSLCTVLDQTSELGASFFCTRLLPECRSVKLILPTIAYQLARFSRPFKYALSEVLQHNPDVHTRALRQQFEGMIIAPLRRVGHTLPMDLVVVIDALDECDESDGVRQILGMLLSHLSDLPIKFYVSSRPEPQIRERIGDVESRLILHELSHTVVSRDIETYLRTELEWMKLSELQIAALVECAGVLFIYAATVVRYIGPQDAPHDPWKRLDIVLGITSLPRSKKDQDMDNLYHFVITSALDDPQLEDWDKDIMKLVLHTVVCAREPLTVEALAGLLKLDNKFQVHAALRSLWSVLHISGTSEFVTTLHASFPEYVLNRQRSKEYYCNVDRHHNKLARLCFERIQRNECQFNICGFRSSYLFDRQVPDLEERVARAIPRDLAYACQYWGEHMKLGRLSGKLLGHLDDFLSKRLLLWMEVMNLTKGMGHGTRILEQAGAWYLGADCSHDLKELIQDAWWFVARFAESSASFSTPHIYVSMLPLWPKAEPVAVHYLSRMKGLAETRGMSITKHSPSFKSWSMKPEDRLFGANVQKEQFEITPDQFTLSVKPIAFSPDCTSAAAACTDHMIRLWDLQRGYESLALSTKSSVSAIAFSPNGMHLGAACGDHKIRLWNLQNGHRASAPLVGHSDLVTSITFSPDGTRIASGSQDHTIRVWNLKKGSTNEPILQFNHTNTITSVAFSPDGTHIASGSQDCTIRLWDLRDEGSASSSGTLLKHSSAVTSVAFSPNGQYIASCARSNVCVWNLRGKNMGQLSTQISEPRTATSVAFSPDGTHIVCGFDDSTLCVCDLQSTRKKVVLRTEADHSSAGPITSIAFSPGGTCVASASSHLILCVLKVQTTLRVNLPYQKFGAVTGIFSSFANAVWGSSPERPPAAPDSSARASLAKHLNGVDIPWLMSEHGCVFNKYSDFLLWVPPDLRGLISGPQNVAGMFQQGAPVQLNLDNAMIGESWTGCYEPASVEPPVRDNPLSILTVGSPSDSIHPYFQEELQAPKLEYTHTKGPA